MPLLFLLTKDRWIEMFGVYVGLDIISSRDYMQYFSFPMIFGDILENS